MTLVDDRLDCGLAIGLNVTSSLGAKNVYPSLDFSLQNDWDVNGTIKEATSQEASQYALYGMYAINQSMPSHLTQFYILKIDVTRKPNWNNFLLYWSPPLLVFALLLVSLKLVIERDLANSLLVYVSTAIFAFGYLSTLRDITPPMVTSLEGFTFLDVSLSFIFSITSIFRRRPKEHEEQTGGSGMSEKEPKDKILELIQLIDKPSCGWKRLSLWRQLQSKISDLISIGLSIFFLFILYYAISLLLPSITDPKVLLPIIIALTALILEFGVVTKELTKPEEREEIIRITTEWNFERLKKQVKEKDHWLLLKALILMKTIQRDFKLSEVRKAYPSLFNEENLVANLYELVPCPSVSSKHNKAYRKQI